MRYTVKNNNRDLKIAVYGKRLTYSIGFIAETENVAQRHFDYGYMIVFNIFFADSAWRVAFNN